MKISQVIPDKTVRDRIKLIYYQFSSKDKLARLRVGNHKFFGWEDEDFKMSWKLQESHARKHRYLAKNKLSNERTNKKGSMA